jgi:tetratricopeptide (TPR) repeat protein
MSAKDHVDVLESANECERHLNAGNFEASDVCLERALSGSQRLLADETKTADALCEVSRTLRRLGDVQLQLGAFGSANKCYSAALDAAVDAVSILTNPVSVQVGAEAIYSLYRFDDHIGDVERRDRRRPNLLKLASYLLHGDEPVGRFWAMRVCAELFADESIARGDLETARVNYEMLCGMMRGVLSHGASPRWREQLGRALSLLGHLEYDRGDKESASKCFEEELQVWHQLLAVEETEDLLSSASWCLLSLGDMERDLQSASSARSRYEQAINLSRRCLSRRRTVAGTHNYIACLQRLGGAEIDRGDLGAAAARFQEALDIHQAMLRSAETPTLLHGVTKSLEGLADIELARGDLVAASVYVKRIHELAKRNLALGDTPVARRLVFVASARCHDMESKLGNQSAAAECMIETRRCPGVC